MPNPTRITPAESLAGALSGPLAGVAFVGGVAAGVAVADAPYPRPGAKPKAIRRYFGANARAARISVAGQLVSAASLARFGAAVAGLARSADPAGGRLARRADPAGGRLARRADPVGGRLARRADPAGGRLATAASASGAVAAASLVASALTSLALTLRPGRSKAGAVRLHRRVFILGGPVHTAAFGVLVGCLSLAGRRAAALPRGLTSAGLVSAGAGALSPLGLLVEPAVWLIPAGRMSGLVVCAIAGARLNRAGS